MTEEYHSQLGGHPGTLAQRFDVADVPAQRPVHPAALVADQDALVDRRPSGICGPKHRNRHPSWSPGGRRRRVPRRDRFLQDRQPDSRHRWPGRDGDSPRAPQSAHTSTTLRPSFGRDAMAPPREALASRRRRRRRAGQRPADDAPLKKDRKKTNKKPNQGTTSDPDGRT